MKTLIAGNWKMNGLRASLAQVRRVGEAAANGLGRHCDIVLCPPTTLLGAAAETGAPIAFGGQDCHARETGAHTGDVSAAMLKDVGASHVILGHSERRADHAESDADVAAKVSAAWNAGLVAILCVGESQEQRDDAQTLDVLRDQLAGSMPDGANADNIVIAYEPVWAIGTGRTPTDAEIAEVHEFLRGQLVSRLGEAGARVPILYGGSLKPSNAAQILSIAEVGGALVGGASLKAEDFIAICEAAPRANA